MNLKNLPALVNRTCYLKFRKGCLMYMEDQLYQTVRQPQKKYQKF